MHLECTEIQGIFVQSIRNEWLRPLRTAQRSFELSPVEVEPDPWVHTRIQIPEEHDVGCEGRVWKF